MRLYAIVPVKAPSRSKARLAVALNPKERLTLTVTMLEDVLNAVKSSTIYQTVLISSDSSVQALANRFGIKYLQETQHGLNQAVKQATEWCVQNGAESVLALPADIPLIEPEDINQIINLGSERPSIVISPSRRGGTNALLQNPPNLIPPCFGPQSFMKHFNKASATGVPAKIHNSPRITLDIDSLDDLNDFLRVTSNTLSLRFLKQTQMQSRLTETNPARCR